MLARVGWCPEAPTGLGLAQIGDQRVEGAGWPMRNLVSAYMPWSVGSPAVGATGPVTSARVSASSSHLNPQQRPEVSTAEYCWTLTGIRLGPTKQLDSVNLMKYIIWQDICEILQKGGVTNEAIYVVYQLTYLGPILKCSSVGRAKE
jgi:hypothetical protein